MLLHTQLSVATRCPQCGQFGVHPLSLFEIPSGKAVSVNCRCGFPKIQAGTRNRHDYYLKVSCIICDGGHFAYFCGRELCSGELHYLYCPESQLEIGILGPVEEVREHAKCWEEGYLGLNEADFGEYFENPSVMYQILEYLHGLAEKGNLMCICGNGKIEMDLFPNRLELRCASCSQVEVIHASSEADLALLVSEGGNENVGEDARFWPLLSILANRRKR